MAVSSDLRTVCSADLRTVCSADLRIVIGDRGTTRTIGLGRALDVASEAGVRRAIARAVSDRPECVLVDLGQLDVIDGRGVAVVLDLARRCQSQPIRLVIFPGSGDLLRAFASIRSDVPLPFVAAAWDRTLDGSLGMVVGDVAAGNDLRGAATG